MYSFPRVALRLWSPLTVAVLIAAGWGSLARAQSEDQSQLQQEQTQSHQQQADRQGQDDASQSEAIERGRQGEAQDQGSQQLPREDRAWLGIGLDDAQGENAGATVVGIYPASPAARAGLQPGDQLLSVAGQEISSASEASDVIRQQEPESELELTVQRGDQQLELTATLGRRGDYMLDQQAYDVEGREQYLEDSQQYPEPLMMLECHRRLFEQNQRLEALILELIDEVDALREEIQGRQSDQESDQTARVPAGNSQQ